ncbi:MAG TPA: FtsX-like permease family protein, partial [Steroidobacteraceae bacterium]|nr:FtsX-like permease family protein [Steroidobacteraceae bacterium]
MRNELYSFVVVSAAVLILLSLISSGIAIAARVLYRSTLLRKEIATRRVLGARRSHIARMFLSENVFAIAAGIAIGSIAMLAAGESRHPWFVTVVLISAATVAAAGALGGWIAGRHASKVPFSESGLFRTSSDTRGH